MYLIGYPEDINNSYNSMTKRQISQLKKWGKDFNRHFSKVNIQILGKHRKRCSASSVIRKMQIKTTIRFHFTSPTVNIIMKEIKEINKEKKCCWGCEATGNLIRCWMEYKMFHLPWKTVWQFLKKLSIELAYVVNIFNHQGNANQNHNEISPHTF